MELKVTDLSVARGGVPLLSGIGWVLGAGQALVLNGPNGIGKTSLLRTLAGLQPVVGGRIEAPTDSIAYAGHADGIKSVLTAAENLHFWASVHGAGGVDAALSAFGLADLAGREAQALSAGQRRRLGLARLLVTGRKIWLLDEPTVSLDRAAVADFADVISAHLAGGGIAVIASHADTGVAAPVLDLAAHRVMRAGRDGQGADAEFLS